MGVLPLVNKYELLQMIADAWGHRVVIEPVDAPTVVDRSLKPTWLRCPLSEQLPELKRWYLSNQVA